MVKPLAYWTRRKQLEHPNEMLQRLSARSETTFAVETSLLLAMVAGASFAGTSSLFAAYLAGGSTSWFYNDVLHTIQNISPAGANTTEGEDGSPKVATQSRAASQQILGHCKGKGDSVGGRMQHTPRTVLSEAPYSNGIEVYETYYMPPVKIVLKPFFFASIGFSIPIRHMLQGPIVWRSLVYSILMLLGKAITGLWLVRFKASSSVEWSLLNKFPLLSLHHVDLKGALSPNQQAKKPMKEAVQQDNSRSVVAGLDGFPEDIAHNHTADPAQRKRHALRKPLSLYPACILSSAMISRGEIGFLIASIAESKGTFGTNSGDEANEIFLIVVWAITLCTVIGPLSVGVLVRRVKKLQGQQQGESNSEDTLGVWGIE